MGHPRHPHPADASLGGRYDADDSCICQAEGCKFPFMGACIGSGHYSPLSRQYHLHRSQPDQSSLHRLHHQLCLLSDGVQHQGEIHGGAVPFQPAENGCDPQVLPADSGSAIAGAESDLRAFLQKQAQYVGGRIEKDIKNAAIWRFRYRGTVIS